MIIVPYRGGSYFLYNWGYTAVHEGGHYLGLYHTFRNGCTPPGDEVDDTPYQADGDNKYQCNDGLNTCPDPEYDPVRNFMNYTDDYCMDQFTNGQSGRCSSITGERRPSLGGTTLEFSSTYTVKGGRSLKIFPGIMLKFASGTSLTIAGTLNAVGTSSQRITFDRSGASGTWGGINIKGTGNTSSIYYCTIKNGDYGVLIGGNRFVDTRYCEIRGSIAAVKIYENGNPQIMDCYIRGDSEADLVSIGNANGKVTFSSLSGTATSGHKNIDAATTIFNYYNSGRNIIKARYGIASVYVLGGYPAYDYGVNIIERSYGSNFYNASGHTLYARYNCWGGSISNYGPVVVDPVYPSCPPNPVGPDWQLAKSSQDILAGAWWAYSDGEYSRAEELAEQAFNEDKAGDRAGEALFLRMKCAHQLGTLAEKQNKLVAVLNDKEVHTSAKHEAVRWQMKFELKRNNIARAKALALSIPDTSNMSREILLSLAIGLLEELKDFEEAERILSLYEGKFTDSESKGIKDEIIGFYRYVYEGKSTLPKEPTEPTASIVPEKSELLSNYPNPFNPSTVISYQLPASGHVSLKVYDMLGQEVATLVDGIQDAGIKSVTFNASHLASGVYFYRLEALGKVLVNKLVLLR